MRSGHIRLGFDVEMDRSAKASPLFFRPWTHNKDFRVASSTPLPYFSDALTSLAFYSVLHKLHPETKTETIKLSDAHQMWKELDPGPSIFQSAQGRITALRGQIPQTPPETVARFEKLIWEGLRSAFLPSGVDLKILSDLNHSIQYFEEEMKQPMLYNFKFSFSNEMRELLQAVESFLFNLRSLVATDLNAHVRDTSHEGFKVDSISDYLPKPEYVACDAMVYHQFKKLTSPFVMGPKSDVRIEKLLVEPMNNSFLQYIQNACYLVNALPPKFLERLSPMDMEEALYLVQMDWILGSDSGTLFKIREELFGLENGYEKVFWPELREKSYIKPAHLHISVELDRQVSTPAQAS